MENIRIEFSEVFDEVERTTEYLGTKNETYDKLRMIDEDKEQMMQWWADGMAVVGIILDRVLAKRIVTSYMTGDAELVLNVSNNNVKQIKDCIVRLVAKHMLCAWLLIVWPDMAQLYKAEEQIASQELMQIAYYREMPR